MKDPKEYDKNVRAAFAAIGAGIIPMFLLYGQEMSTTMSLLYGAALLGFMVNVPKLFCTLDFPFHKSTKIIKSKQVKFLYIVNSLAGLHLQNPAATTNMNSLR